MRLIRSIVISILKYAVYDKVTNAHPFLGGKHFNIFPIIVRTHYASFFYQNSSFFTPQAGSN